ncbi:MAG: alcohol dehydrogenase catalytic domain-containing protein, partial [Porticoccaceae bacterium]|nr:alcohol dehydrogenase catalytic domain-containing protein [Porticoccaceae bacterium]
MKNLSIITILALFLGSTSFAGNGDEAASGTQYIEFSQIGNPAEVLEIKHENARPLSAGDIRVEVLAAPINPSDLLQIAGKYGVDPVLPYRPGSEGVGRVLEVSAEVKHI